MMVLSFLLNALLTWSMSPSVLWLNVSFILHFSAGLPVHFDDEFSVLDTVLVSTFIVGSNGDNSMGSGFLCQVLCVSC